MTADMLSGSGIGSLKSRHYTSVDQKGRVPLQQSFRQKFGDEVVGLIEHGGLTVLTPEEYETVARHVLQSTAFNTPETAHRFFDEHLREWREEFFANSVDLSFDNQGRLSIPKKLRDALEMPLEAEVVWMAAGGHLRLRRAADVEAIDCAQRAGALGKHKLTMAPPVSPSAPNGGSGGDGGNQS